MCELVVIDIIDELMHENRRLRNELDVQRLNASLQPPIGSTVDTCEDIDDSDNDTIIDGTDETTIGSNDQQRHSNDDNSVLAVDTSRRAISGQPFDPKVDVRAHVTIENVGLSMANNMVIKVECLVDGCGHEFVANVSLNDHMKNEHHIQDSREYIDCHQSADIQTPDVSVRSDDGHEVFDNNGGNDSSVESEEDAVNGREEQHDSGSNGCADTSAKLNTDVDEDSGGYSGSVGASTSGEPSNGRQFKCFFGCDKTFNSKSNRNRHHFVHTPDKPLKCTFIGCKYSTTDTRCLDTHRNQHLGRKPYACRHCGQRFAAERYRNGHYRTAHTPGKERHKCPHPSCNERFKTLANLRAHRVAAHQEVSHRAGAGNRRSSLRPLSDSFRSYKD